MSVEDILLGWSEMEAALPDYLEAQAYAEGKVDEVFASSGEIAMKLAKASRAYRFPFIVVPITARVNRCKINTIKADNELATKAIEDGWAANDMDVWYPELFWQTFMFGDAYTMVWPIDQDEDGADEYSEAPADQELLAAGAEINVFDPLNARMIYDPLNVRRKLFFIQRFQQAEDAGPTAVKLWRVDLWFTDRIERWISVKDGDLSKPESWQPYAEDAADGREALAEDEPHEYGEIPWFHHRTALPYGSPVHKLGYGAQNAVTKMLATQLDVSDDQGWPHRYRLLDPDAELDTNQDDTAYLDDDDASVFSPGGIKARGGTQTAQRTGPGTIQTYPGTKEVGAFPAADPNVFLEPAMVYLKAMATLTSTSNYLFFPENSAMGQAPSGIALQREDAPLNASVGRLQTFQRGALREEWLFYLKLQGLKAKELDIQWEPIERATTVEDWTVVGLKQQNGVPVDQTLTEAGYTTEQAEEWRAEQEKADQEMRDQMMEAAAASGKDTKPPNQPIGKPSGGPPK